MSRWASLTRVGSPRLPCSPPSSTGCPTRLLPCLGSQTAASTPTRLPVRCSFYLPLAWAGWAGYLRQNGRFLNFLWLSLSLAATGALILTQSRSGWLGGAAALYLLIALWAFSLPKTQPRRRQLFALLGVLTLIGFTALLAIGPERLAALWEDPAQQTAVGSLGSLSFRQEMWRWTIVTIQDFPFTGVGLGSFRHVIRRLYPLAIDPGYDVAHAHNIFLHTAVDIGIPGLIIYLALIGLVLTLGWQAAKQNAPMRPYALGLTAGLIAFHVYGIADVLALGSKTGLAFWILIGLIVTLNQMPHTPAQLAKQP
ncbi:MAG: O-antigen ligase family protein [Anaerolineaceae bacterium]|nr:O-antigen ligase family protein [Anaerolineaceae bacterium]